jgi:hypothetical protein
VECVGPQGSHSFGSSPAARTAGCPKFPCPAAPTIAASPYRAGESKSVLDSLSAEFLELLEAIPHSLEHLRGVTLPLRDLAGDPQWLPGAV